jgi:uncharacterized metal-binding protein YceD (DUF177 family)
MKIEFKKVPQTQKDFELNLNSVKFSGTFCRISSVLAKIDGSIEGKLEVYCAKCGSVTSLDLDEQQKFIISDVPFSIQDERDEELVIEIEDHIIDFDAILQSEIESIESDIHICSKCEENNTFIDLEF